MKNKKGFTLIELLSVIVLIGIVLSLAVLGVSSIRKKVLEKQYINVKTEDNENQIYDNQKNTIMIQKACKCMYKHYLMKAI